MLMQGQIFSLVDRYNLLILQHKIDKLNQFCVHVNICIGKCHYKSLRFPKTSRNLFSDLSTPLQSLGESHPIGVFNLTPHRNPVSDPCDP